MRNNLFSAKDAVIYMANGGTVERTDMDDEEDQTLVWFSPHCYGFHYSYNGIFNGIYTGSFANMVPFEHACSGYNENGTCRRNGSACPGITECPEGRVDLRSQEAKSGV
jgi:hypothetical protein